MKSKGKLVTRNAAEVQLRRQGPWLIMRFYYPDGCRFCDELVVRILGEDEEAVADSEQSCPTDGRKLGAP